MSVSRDHIDRLIADRTLISVRRKRVDDRCIQAFPLAVSDRLVLLQYVYDFHIDGFMLLRLRDISDCKIGDTNIFQRRLLQEEGVFDEVQFDFRVPIGSYPDFLRSLSPTELVIVESERTDPPQMHIGTVASADSRTVAINHITGIARREDEPRQMAVRDITSCQIRTNYISFYQRHFDRLGPMISDAECNSQARPNKTVMVNRLPAPSPNDFRSYNPHPAVEGAPPVSGDSA